MPISNTPHNESFPAFNVNQEGGINRYLPLPTAQTLRNNSLFGIPLRSSFTGQEVSDEMLSNYVSKAISELEHSLNIYVMPVQFTERYDYDKEIWTRSYAWQKLYNGPVLDVQSVQLSFGNGTPLPPIVDFPLEFCFVDPQDAAIRLVPVLGTPTAGFTLSSFSGAQWSALLAAGVANFPGAFLVTYRAGFDLNKVPALIAGLIEKMAALQVLSTMGPLIFPFNSVSLGLDGVSQSSGTAGPQFLASRINDLKESIAKELDTAKGYYLKRTYIDYL